MPASTPISHSKTAALTRILDLIPRGYHQYTCGTVKAAKAIHLANKFHTLYRIGASPAQRLVRKRQGLANALLVMYWPEGAEGVHWLLLVTDGTGLEAEHLRSVTDKPRLEWLGYELVRHATRGRTSWTWRRPKVEMAEHYVLLDALVKQRHQSGIRAWLERLANQPGFHGVRTQTWALCEETRRRGYEGELPFIYYVQKLSHGEPLALNTV
ncbi:MAG: hypothetical protein Q8S26_04665 [Azonexus sp.]|nr:hypothetical protein [Azonexus sp.]